MKKLNEKSSNRENFLSVHALPDLVSFKSRVHKVKGFAVMLCPEDQKQKSNFRKTIRIFCASPSDRTASNDIQAQLYNIYMNKK